MKEPRFENVGASGLDWSHVPTGEDRFDPCEAPALKSARCETFLAWIRARPEKHIAVVSHSNFLTHLTEMFLPETSGDGPNGATGNFRFANAEMKRVMLREK